MTEPGASAPPATTARCCRAVPGPDRSGPDRVSLDPATNPARSGPRSTPSCCELVREHTSTIIFVNNRRGAERLAKRLNELHNEEPEQELPATEHAGNGRRPAPAATDSFEEIARAHHGSLAHEERLVVEELLKSGKLPCLVATSSLELGIDMGAVDLVIQVESPKSVVARPAAGRPRRPPARRDLEGPDLPQVPRRPARVRGGRQADARRARSRRR